jgi:hypothetical protein
VISHGTALRYIVESSTVYGTDEFCLSKFVGEIKRIERFVGLRKEPSGGKNWAGRSDKKHYEEIMECRWTWRQKELEYNERGGDCVFMLRRKRKMNGLTDETRHKCACVRASRYMHKAVCRRKDVYCGIEDADK